MDSETLRRACERAGMRVKYDAHGGFFIVGPYGGVLSSEEREDREWIESRCADLLVGMVRESPLYAIRYMGALAGQVHGGPGFSARGFLATPEQRITAALEVLA